MAFYRNNESQSTARSYKKLAVAISGVTLFLLLAVALTGSVKNPYKIRILYYRLLFSITGAEQNPETMRKLHKATPVSQSKVSGYEYRAKDRALTLSDSVRCVACHGPMYDPDKKVSEKEHHAHHAVITPTFRLKKGEKSKEKVSIHQLMLGSPVAAFNCTDCHKEVDLRKRGAGRQVRKVDRRLCANMRCHKGFPLEQNPKHPQRVAKIEPNCPSCHTTTVGRPYKHNRPFLRQVIDADKCITCHGKTKLSTEAIYEHGGNEKERKRWLKRHPRKAMEIGMDKCMRCHSTEELDFCKDCHSRGGMRPSHHQPLYKIPLNKIYPKNSSARLVETKWLGFHFVLVRENLQRMGVKDVSARNLPLEKVEKLTCVACHEIEDWCTRCHIKHNPKWLDPKEGHPAFIKKFGRRYCSRCHDSLSAKCLNCHADAEQIR